MSYRQSFRVMVIVGLALGTQIAQSQTTNLANRSLREIAACMRANIVERGAVRDFHVTATDREGTTNELEVKVFWKPAATGPDERMTLHVEEPESLAGTAYLVVATTERERIYLYLPALERVQQVVGSEMTDRLWGTDFTFADIKQLQGLLLDGDVSRLANTEVSDRPAYLLETVTSIERTGYSRVLSYVDMQSCTLAKAELFSDSDTPHKVLEGDLSTLLEIDPWWIMLKYRMTDRRNGTHTDVDLSDVYIQERLPESRFMPESFYVAEE